MMGRGYAAIAAATGGGFPPKMSAYGGLAKAIKNLSIKSGRRNSLLKEFNFYWLWQICSTNFLEEALNLLICPATIYILLKMFKNP